MVTYSTRIHSSISFHVLVNPICWSFEFIKLHKNYMFAYISQYWFLKLKIHSIFSPKSSSSDTLLMKFIFVYNVWTQFYEIFWDLGELFVILFSATNNWLINGKLFFSCSIRIVFIKRIYCYFKINGIWYFYLLILHIV